MHWLNPQKINPKSTLLLILDVTLQLIHNLIDSWRYLHLGEKDYSFYSPVHSSFSRIDMIWVSLQVFTSITQSRIQLRSFSDYALVVLQFSKSEYIKPKWRFDNSLLQNEFKTYIKSWISSFMLARLQIAPGSFSGKLLKPLLEVSHHEYKSIYC